MREIASAVEMILRLSRETDRAGAVDELARTFGIEEIRLFVADPELGVILPARGFPQTLSGGPAWRSFLVRLETPGRYEGEVDFPKGRVPRRVAGVAVSGAAAVLFGGTPAAGDLDLLEQLLRAVVVILRSEQAVLRAEARADAALESASWAQGLATALEGARAEAAALNADLLDERARKDDFLAMLAHELRNPLAPLLSAIEILRMTQARPEFLGRQLELMGRQVGHLSRLVEDLLDVSRINYGRVNLRMEGLDLNDVLTESVEAAASVVEVRSQQLVTRFTDEALRIVGDPLRLTQVFGNLINNAGKYTSNGGRISVRTAREGDHAVVEVADTGIGIAPEMLHKIFDLFTQVPVSLDRSRGGLGIGLTVVQKLVDMHGGSVAAESAGLGHGTTLKVRLPLILESAEPTAPASTPGAEKGEVIAGPLRILIVDTDDEASNALALKVQQFGHAPYIARDGARALCVGGQVDIDAILLDADPRDEDSYQAARRIQRQQSRRPMLVALKGKEPSGAKGPAVQSGFDAQLSKPPEPGALSDLLDRIATLRATGA